VGNAVIHIGTPKTATTTIQRFLQFNSDLLASAGWSVPKLWRGNQSALSVLSYQRSRWDETCAFHAHRLGYGNDRLSSGGGDDLRKSLKEELDLIIRQSKNSTLVFSSEGLYSKLESPDVSRFRALLNEAGVHAKIVVYLRDPLSARISQISQFVKAGWHLDLGASLGPSVMPQRLPVPRWLGAPPAETTPSELYNERLAVWEEHFPGHVHVRLFDPQEFTGGTVVQDFCHAAGIEWDSRFAVPSRVNAALPWPIVKTFNEVNRFINRRALLDDGNLNLQRWVTPWDLREYTWTSGKATPNTELVRIFSEYFSSSNEEIRRRYLSDRSNLWSPIIGASETSIGLSVDLTEGELAMVDLLVQLAETQTLVRTQGELSRLGTHHSHLGKTFARAVRGIKESLGRIQ